MTFRTARLRAAAFGRTPRGRRIALVVRTLVVAGIVALLVYRLSRIGWDDVLAALPSTPWFYVLFAALYVLLPLGETVIYRALWDVRTGPLFAALLRKKVLNQDVLNYAGELYFVAWARRRVRGVRREVTMQVKDNLIVSSVASTVAALGVLGAFAATGAVDLHRYVDVPSGWAVAAAVGAGLVVLAGLVRYRRALFAVEGRTLGLLWGVHLGRFVLTNVLQVAQWYVVVPEAPFEAWAILLAALLVTNRIPLLPSKDLLFVSVGVELAATMGVPAAVVAGMLLVRGVGDKVLNLALFAGLGAGAARRARQAATPVPAAS